MSGIDERIREPEDPDAVDRDVYRTPDPDEPRPEPERDPGEREEAMRLPGEDAPEIVGSGPGSTDALGEAEAPDAVGSREEPW